MPTFDAPEPISVTIELVLGDVQITASDRTDAVVEVLPTHPANALDVQAAQQTRVEYANGKLLVKAPKQRAFGLLSTKCGSIDVTIELPAGSHVRGDAAMAAFRCEGRLGDCRFKTATGNVQIQQAGALDLNTAAGDVTVDRANGHVDVVTGTGAVRLGEIQGPASIKNSNGETWIGEVTGELRVNAANGGITVDRAHADVSTKTANGSIRLGEVVRGSVSLGTALGELEVGVRAGTAAWLDLNSTVGTVRNHLDATDGPGSAEETVEVHARTSFGDIVIRRS